VVIDAAQQLDLQLSKWNDARIDARRKEAAAKKLMMQKQRELQELEDLNFDTVVDDPQQSASNVGKSREGGHSQKRSGGNRRPSVSSKGSSASNSNAAQDAKPQARRRDGFRS